MFVYTTGHGVFGFTLDPSVWRICSSKQLSEIKTRKTEKFNSVNEANINKWEPRVVDYINHLQNKK